MDNPIIGRKISVLRLTNQSSMVTDLGNFKNPLTKNTKRKNDTAMVVLNEGALVTFTLPKVAHPVEVLIPWGNIVSVELEANEENS